MSDESASAAGAAATGPAVFLSYASEDAAAAQRLCDVLRAAGIEIWFDKSELRGGDAWDAAIRRQIKGCALFIPIISTNAHARTEGYFRFEWKLAVDRSHLMAPDKPFLLPVAIDDTPQSDERIPERFRELQWTRLPGGETPPAFVARVQRLLFPAAAREAGNAAARGAGGAASGSAPPSIDPTGSAAAAGSRSTQRALIWAVAQDLVQAETLYRQTLKLDPNYGPAWVGLALCLGRQVAQGSVGADGAGASPQWYASQHAEIVAAANRAIALNPNLPDAYVAAAITYIQYDLNWSAAADALAKARALDPNNVEMLALYGHLTAATGQAGEAAAYFRRAMQGDPLNLLHRKYLGRALHYAGRPADSAEVLRRAIALDAHFPGLHYELGRALLVAKDAAAASAAFEAEPAESSAWRVLGLPLGYHATGDNPRAKAALADLLAHSQGAEFQVAEAVAFFGDRDGALQWLEKARVNHDPGVVWVRHDALFASIAGDPRFAAYLKRLGQPPN